MGGCSAGFLVKRASEALVVNAGDQLAAADDLRGGAAEPDVEAGVGREEHLVAGAEALGVRADGDHDPEAAVRFGAGRQDQTGARLRFLVGRLDHDVVVERLKREPDRSGIRARVVEHD
jgi:hypothetical protein